MQLDDEILTLFTGRIETRDGDAVIRIPEQELDLGTLEAGQTYRVAIQAAATAEGSSNQGTDTPSKVGGSSEAPVTKGEQLDVEIEDVGEQGDGIARVGPGYVIFVPDADVGDRVTIEVTQVRENFAFAEVVTPEPVAG